MKRTRQITNIKIGHCSLNNKDMAAPWRFCSKFLVAFFFSFSNSCSTSLSLEAWSWSCFSMSSASLWLCWSCLCKSVGKYDWIFFLNLQNVWNNPVSTQINAVKEQQPPQWALLSLQHFFSSLTSRISSDTGRKIWWGHTEGIFHLLVKRCKIRDLCSTLQDSPLLAISIFLFSRSCVSSFCSNSGKKKITLRWKYSSPAVQIINIKKNLSWRQKHCHENVDVNKPLMFLPAALDASLWVFFSCVLRSETSITNTKRHMNRSFVLKKDEIQMHLSIDFFFTKVKSLGVCLLQLIFAVFQLCLCQIQPLLNLWNKSQNSVKKNHTGTFVSRSSFSSTSEVLLVCLFQNWYVILQRFDLLMKFHNFHRFKWMNK